MDTSTDRRLPAAIKYIGRTDLLYYGLLAVATSCLYAVGFDRGLGADAVVLRPLLTFVGAFLVSVLTAAYVSADLPASGTASRHTSDRRP